MKHLLLVLPAILVMAYIAKFLYHWMEATQEK